MKIALPLILLLVLLAGCVKMVTVTSGTKVVCSECQKVINSDIQTQQVPETEAANYSVRETTTICDSCQAKIAEKQRQERRTNMAGPWHAPAPMGTLTMMLNSDGTGFLTHSALGERYNLKWHIEGKNLVYTDSTGTFYCPIQENGGAFTMQARGIIAVFTR